MNFGLFWVECEVPTEMVREARMLQAPALLAFGVVHKPRPTCMATHVSIMLMHTHTHVHMYGSIIII